MVVEEKAAEYINEKLCQISKSKLNTKDKRKYKMAKFEESQDESSSSHKSNPQLNVSDASKLTVFEKLNMALCHSDDSSLKQQNENTLNLLSTKLTQQDQKIKTSDLPEQLKSLMEVYSHFRSLLTSSLNIHSTSQSKSITESIELMNAQIKKLSESIQSHFHSS